jgi:hypothetical protein
LLDIAQVVDAADAADVRRVERERDDRAAYVVDGRHVEALGAIEVAPVASARAEVSVHIVVGVADAARGVACDESWAIDRDRVARVARAAHVLLGDPFCEAVSRAEAGLIERERGGLIAVGGGCADCRDIMKRLLARGHRELEESQRAEHVRLPEFCVDVEPVDGRAGVEDGVDVAGERRPRGSVEAEARGGEISGEG